MADVVTFPTEEVNEDQALAAAFERQRQMDDIALAVAQLVYRGRALWIGGGALPWDALSPAQMKLYRDEALTWIREVQW